MKRAAFLLVFVAGCATTLDDFTVNDFTVDQTADVTSADALVTCSIDATTTGQAVSYAGCAITSPEGREYSCLDGSPVGDVFECDVELPQNSIAGTYEVIYAFVTGPSYHRKFSRSELIAGSLPGVPNEAALDIDVDSVAPDNTPPVISSIQVTPATLDVSTGGTVTVTVTASDPNTVTDTSGTFLSPSGSDEYSCLALGGGACTFDVPPASEEGTYTPSSISARDGVGNAVVQRGLSTPTFDVVSPPPGGCDAFVADASYSVGAGWSATTQEAPAATGSVNVDVYLRPSDSPMDALFVLSEVTPVDYWDDGAVTIRFNSSGEIDVRDGLSYGCPGHTCPAYTADKWYHFVIDADITAQTFDVQYEDCDSGLVDVATDAAFRTQAGVISSLEYRAALVDAVYSPPASTLELDQFAWSPTNPTGTIEVDMAALPGNCSGASWSVSPGGFSGSNDFGPQTVANDDYTITWLDTAFPCVPPTTELLTVNNDAQLFDLSPSNYATRTTRNVGVDVQTDGGADIGQTWTVVAAGAFSSADMTEAGSGDETPTVIVDGTPTNEGVYDAREYAITFDAEAGYTTPTAGNITAASGDQSFVGDYLGIGGGGGGGGGGTGGAGNTGGFYVTQYGSGAPETPTCGESRWIDIAGGDDGDPGSDAQPWQTLSKATTYAESRAAAGTQTCIYIKPTGNYGNFDWCPPATTSWVWWIADSGVPRFNRIDMTCGSTRDVRQVIDGVEVQMPSGNSYDAMVTLLNSDYVEIRNSEVWAYDLYRVTNGIKALSKRVTVRGNNVHDTIHSIRYKGRYVSIVGNEITRTPGSALSMLCGGYDSEPQSGRYIELVNNLVHDVVGDYPSEPNYACCDEPAELHASLVSVRGSDTIIRGNWFHDVDNQRVGMQAYLGDCGVSNYLVSDLTITDNVLYDSGATGGFFQWTASPTGPIYMNNNTVFSSVRIDISKPSALGYTGTGTTMNDNFGVGAICCPITAPYSGTGECKNNRYALVVYPCNASTVPSPPNENVGSDKSFFRSPPTGSDETCLPRGAGPCDLRLTVDHPYCTAGEGGGQIGAIPCE